MKSPYHSLCQIGGRSKLFLYTFYCKIIIQEIRSKKKMIFNKKGSTIEKSFIVQKFQMLKVC